MQYLNRQIWTIPNLPGPQQDRTLADILTRDHGEYAVYRVIVPARDALHWSDAEWLHAAYMGVKLSFSQALPSFPGLIRSEYRS